MLSDFLQEKILQSNIKTCVSGIRKSRFFVVTIVFIFIFCLYSWFSSTSTHVLKCQKYNSTVSETNIYKTNSKSIGISSIISA